MPWQDIKSRFNPSYADAGFWACVSKTNNGKLHWFDSSTDHNVAIGWCMASLGISSDEEDKLSSTEKMVIMNDNGMSIIHSNVLEMLADQELVI